MQQEKARPSSFPYLVLVVNTIARIVLAGLSIWNLQRNHADLDSDQGGMMLATVIGSSLAAWAISSAFAFAFSQSLLERRRIGGMPGYAAVVIALLNTAIGFALLFAMQYVLISLYQTYGNRGALQLLGTVMALGGHLIVFLATVSSVWLTFRLLRHKALPALQGAQEMRARAWVVFALFVAAWVWTVAHWLAPVSIFYLQSIELLRWVPYVGAIGLMLPMLIGGWLGLPATLDSARALRMWAAATSAVIASALIMVGFALGLVRFHHFGETFNRPDMWLLIVSALGWFAASTVAARALMRVYTRRGVAYRAAAQV